MKRDLVRSYVKINNFGDKLNALLVERIFGEYLIPDVHLDVDQKHHACKVFAIGSFLSHELLAQLDANHRAVFFGLGSGYAQFPIIRTFGTGSRFPARVGNALTLPTQRETPPRGPGHAIYWVRGPLTTQLMGLPDHLAVGDAGYLIRQCDIFDTYHTDERSGIVFMPHFTAATSAVGLRYACEGLGIRYIDPGGAETEILAAIAGAKVLVTEALHGAVIADALRTPWIAVKSSDDIFEFKWRDFCTSIGVTYEPQPIRVRWDVRYFTGRHPRNLSRYVLNRVRSRMSQLQVRASDTAYDLLIALGRSPNLSSEAALARIDEGIKRGLNRFFDDYARDAVFR